MVYSKADDFFNYLEGQRKDAKELSFIHSCIVLFALLECLAKVVPDTDIKTNRSRFLNLINNYSGWTDKDRVSLCQLCLYLETNYKKKYESEIKLIENKIYSVCKNANMPRGYELDPMLNDVDIDIPFKGLESCLYSSLLWKMRNMLVHEFRTPGKGFPLSRDNSTPYYINFFDPESDEDTWELVFSPELISSISKDCIVKLKSEYRKITSSPYDIVRNSTNWHD